MRLEDTIATIGRLREDPARPSAAGHHETERLRTGRRRSPSWDVLLVSGCRAVLLVSLDAVGDRSQDQGQLSRWQLRFDLPGSPVNGWRILEVGGIHDEAQCYWPELAELLEQAPTSVELGGVVGPDMAQSSTEAGDLFGPTARSEARARLRVGAPGSRAARSRPQGSSPRRAPNCFEDLRPMRRGRLRRSRVQSGANAVPRSWRFVTLKSRSAGPSCTQKVRARGAGRERARALAHRHVEFPSTGRALRESSARARQLGGDRAVRGGTSVAPYRSHRAPT